MAEERKNDARDPIRDGIKAGLGILGALKEALEETFEEAMKEREFGPDRARDAFKETVRRAQETMEQARDRFDFVPRRDFDALKAQVDALRHQVEQHVASSTHQTYEAAGGFGAGSGPTPEGSDPGALAGEGRARDIPVDQGE